MIKGFKEFILRGNVIDLAVAVVIGAAFTLVVNAIVTGLINPLIGLLFNAKSLEHLTAGPILWGSILSAIINFLIVAVVVYFVFVFPMNVVRERAERRKQISEQAQPDLPTEQELLVQIRDLLQAQKP
jgi:large conductance mechanosensitive channel